MTSIIYFTAAWLIVSTIIFIASILIDAVRLAIAEKKYSKMGKCDHKFFSLSELGRYKWCKVCVNQVYLTSSEFEKVKKDLRSKKAVIKIFSVLFILNGVVFLLCLLLKSLDEHPIIQVAIAITLLLLIIVIIINRRNEVRLEKARKQYYETKRCGHLTSDKWEFYTLGQTGVPGVITMTNKWCKVCGRLIGPAKLVNGKWV